jgi:hypothetical protein
MELRAIFSEIYDFCKIFLDKELIKDESKRKSGRKKGLHVSEIMTILVWFHYSKYKCFKYFYEIWVKGWMKNEFRNAPSYNRFVELKNEIMEIMILYAVLKNHAETNGISIIDSFSIEACHIKRSSSHKTLKDIAKKGKTSMGWFFGLKLHVVINAYGVICSFAITPGNIADNNESLLTYLTKEIFGKLFGDKGYLVRAEVYQKLYENGVQLITKIKKNMKNKFYNLHDALMLKKRGVVESVGNVLKNVLSIEHSRHRSVAGVFVHIFSSLIAYAFKEKKPSIFKKKLTLP